MRMCDRAFVVVTEKLLFERWWLGSSKCWKLIGLEMRLHKYIHIHQGICTMLGVRWSHALLVLCFIAFLLFFGSYKQYGITLIPLRTSVVALF